MHIPGSSKWKLNVLRVHLHEISVIVQQRLNSLHYCMKEYLLKSGYLRVMLAYDSVQCHICITEEIMTRIREAGFHIAARKETELTQEIAQQFYRDQEGKEYFGTLTEHMTRYLSSKLSLKGQNLLIN